MTLRKLISWMIAGTIALIPISGISYAESTEIESMQTAGTEVNDQPAGFSDIEGHWAEKIIEEASALKIVGGYPNGTFLPDNLIKREEFYKLLTNIMTVVPDTSSTVIKFTDVEPDEWYTTTIKIAVAAGITSGYSDGTFGIGQMISRQEAAKVAGSVISHEMTENDEAIKDEPNNEEEGEEALSVEAVSDNALIADWAYRYVDLMFRKGYMKGDNEGNFRPTTALTRAEAATILLQIKKHESVIGADTGVTADSDCLSAHAGLEGIFSLGKGTESEPYEISTEAQLNHLRMHVTEGAFYILKKNIAITEDYVDTAPADRKETDWSEGNFAPIGSKAVPFQGSIDGNGFVVSGLNLSGTEGSGDSKSRANYTGLFGYLAKGSVIKNLTVDASNIIGNQYTGAIAGYSEGTIENCELGSKGIIVGASYTGGVAGFSSQMMKGVNNRGTVTGTKAYTGGITGAIVSPGTAMSDCRNYGLVSGCEKTGGITGSFNASLDAASVIENCQNHGTVTGNSYQAGGIAGYVSTGYYSSTIENCMSTGEVTGSGVNGGIAGWLEKGKNYVIKSRNSGTVEGSGAGGIVGKCEGVVSFCYNSGTVISDMSSGGIAAYQLNSGGEITLSYNEGNVIANGYAGGISGENESRIENGYNCGKIRGSGIGGGIAGKNTGSVKNAYGAGTVTSQKTTGSLIGRNSGTLSNCFWLNSSSAAAVGLEDNASGLQSVYKVSHDELSGQKKVKTVNGYEMLIDLLNQKGEVWEYLYNIVVPAPGSTTVLSDGGSIVTPIEVPSEDSTGNTVDSADLISKYLYPAVID